MAACQNETGVGLKEHPWAKAVIMWVLQRKLVVVIRTELSKDASSRKTQKNIDTIWSNNEINVKGMKKLENNFTTTPEEIINSAKNYLLVLKPSITWLMGNGHLYGIKLKSYTLHFGHKGKNTVINGEPVI